VPVLTNKAANAATIATSTRPNTFIFSLAAAEIVQRSPLTMQAAILAGRR
jgi:hypothetical protein